MKQLYLVRFGDFAGMFFCQVHVSKFFTDVSFFGILPHMKNKKNITIFIFNAANLRMLVACESNHRFDRFCENVKRENSNPSFKDQKLLQKVD